MTATKAVAAAKAHDKDGILNVGEEIDNACESCHKVYRYRRHCAEGAVGDLRRRAVGDADRS